MSRVAYYSDEYYHEKGESALGYVKYNQNLDEWNGSNWQNGGVGMHKGLTKVNGGYVLIIGSQWQGSRDYGYMITAQQALNEIIQSGNYELLDEPRFAQLKEMYDKLQ